MPMRLSAVAPLVASSLLVIGCFRGPYTVTRVVHGKEVVGPFVSDEAYALYLQGAILEAEGRGQDALSFYDVALRHDPKSPDLWTRRGVVLCGLGANPWASFDRAVEVNPRYEVALTERARCHLSRGEDGAALSYARQAVKVEPRTTENVLLLGMVLERMGKVDEARALLDELAGSEPRSVEAHRARLELAIRTGDDVRKEAAARRLLELAPEVAADFADRVPSLSPLALMDEALSAGRLDEARRLALEARISSGTVALRAVAIGSFEEAKEQATLTLSADPADTDARVALAMVAHLQNDEAALGKALSDLPAEPMPLSPSAKKVLGELVRLRMQAAMP